MTVHIYRRRTWRVELFTAMGSEERNTEAGTRAQEGEEEEGEELCLYHWEPQSFWKLELAVSCLANVVAIGCVTCDCSVCCFLFFSFTVRT